MPRLCDVCLPKNGSYELTLTAYRNTADPGDATGWYRYCASYTMNIQPKAVLSSERVSQGGVAALVITGILDGSEPTVETDLGDVWFRPVTGGYMGYIPVTYNAEGGPHTLTVTWRQPDPGADPERDAERGQNRGCGRRGRHTGRSNGI